MPVMICLVRRAHYIVLVRGGGGGGFGHRRPPVLWAAVVGSTAPVVAALLDAGADVNARDGDGPEEGESCLVALARYGHGDSAQRVRAQWWLCVPCMSVA